MPLTLPPQCLLVKQKAHCMAINRRLVVAMEERDTATLRDVLAQLCDSDAAECVADERARPGTFFARGSDLVYAPRAWVALLAALDGAALAGRDVCYVHCGGVEGVATQLNRYRHAGLLDASSDADPWRRDVPAAGAS